MHTGSFDVILKKIHGRKFREEEEQAEEDIKKDRQFWNIVFGQPTLLERCSWLFAIDFVTLWKALA